MQKILLKLLLFYKNFISPLLPRRCRFYPSCSQYAYEAIEKKGAFKGIIYTLIRITKCHPFHPGGYDPIR
jgi:putative membrane protein insertion efficiency factor